MKSEFTHRSAIVVLLSLLFLPTRPVSGQARPLDGALPLLVPAQSNPSARCSVERDGPFWWHVGPRGEQFFSLGVSVVTPGADKSAFDPNNRSYAAFQHYDTKTLWADATLRRLTAWRFTTVGGWSDVETLRTSSKQSLWLTPVLHVGSTAGAPWFDMWDPQVVARMERVAATQIDKLRDDPRVIGYYSDNDLGWWMATLWKMTWEHPATSGQRQRLAKLVRDNYPSDWDQLVADFEPRRAASWQELEQQGSLAFRPTGNGSLVMRKFLRTVADRYYSLTADIIRRHDARALVLGDRYQSFM